MALSDLSLWNPTLWARTALMHLRPNLGVIKRMNRDYDSEVASFGNTVNVPVPPTLAAALKVAGTNYNFAAVSASTIPVVMDKNAYSAFEIDNVAKLLAKPDAMMLYGKSAANAIASQIETAVLGEWVNAGSFVGAAGVDLTKALLLTARKKLNDGLAPLTLEDRSVILSTKDAQAILGDLSTSNAGSMFNDKSPLRQGDIGNLYGFGIMESQLVPFVTTTTHNLAFHRDAITFVNRPLEAPNQGMGVKSDVVYDEDLGISLRVMMQFSIDSGSYKIVYDVLYGFKTMRPQWVVDLRA
jgi:P22 coat protein - gene protein 5